MVPDWLASTHRARLCGNDPPGLYLILSLGPSLARRLPVAYVPRTYCPQPKDDLSALYGLSLELVFDEWEPLRRLRNLVALILCARPERLIAFPIDRPAFLLLKRGGA
ncbi:hypothetical protein [Cupriavidus sp. AcVe19-6a]|uniref:hypothetical protein n=1 Tax=Cupriavidus sp. AcVe19-6a TaxID=2821358 RepID=UPI001AE1A1B9|nr:hypothetical protein [Cupriavidus sp. AcVe19-6a]MBP0634243.1 hypothetical protein [Cupriavidus sp. AcVe19-6a]